MTETWLRPGTDDSVEIGTLCATGYRVIHVPKSHSAGGGVNLELQHSARPCPIQVLLSRYEQNLYLRTPVRK